MITTFSLFLLMVAVSTDAMPNKNCDSDSCSDQKSTLVMTQAIWRHGDRNIENTYQNDPYKSLKYWPEGYGQLTNLGKKQQYNLGKWLRERYQERLFPKGYHVDKIYVEASEYDRTLMSAAANLAGLFPPNEYQRWNEHLDWQPMPIRMVPANEDTHIIPLNNPCPLHEKLLEEYGDSFYSNYEYVFSSLPQYIGQNLTRTGAVTIYDSLRVERMKGLKLPKWTKHFYKPLKEMAMFFFVAQTGTPELARLGGGFMIKEILDKFVNKSHSNLSPDRTFFAYSGHDITIANTLNTLRMFDHKFPPYAACLLFELHYSNGVYYIEIFYRKSSEQLIGPMNIPNCGTRCPLEQFHRLYEPIIPTEDYETECALPASS